MHRRQMDTKLIFVVIGVTTTMFGSSEAITCYLCDSRIDSRCLDPFNYNGVGTCEGLACGKYKVTTSGMFVTFIPL